MADLKGGNKKRLTINLSLFASNDHNSENYPRKSTNKSPKSFEPNGVVGLGIVAAMNEMDQTHDPFFSAKSSRAAILALSPRSTPIPILNKNTIRESNFVGPKLEEKEEDMELCEEYTCVISHIGNNLIRKREYFDDVLANESESSVSCGVVSAYDAVVKPVEVKEPVVVFRTADFLNSCYLCKKQLQGLDIFMYRGEKAFCSTECRCKQISMDERKEKCGSGAMKSLEYSVSPCSGPMQFLAGLAAA